MMKKSLYGWITALAIALLVGEGLFLYTGQHRRPQPAPAPEVSQAAPPAPAASAAPAPASPSAPAVQHPIEAVVVEQELPKTPVDDASIADALTQLVGRKAMLSFFQTDEFSRSLVATVDNLGRTHAPSRLWPVHATPGQFTVSTADGTQVIDSDNGMRYVPFVLLAETIDVGAAVSLYVRMYPTLQRTYEDLGYPRRQFNDRVVEVIDNLLATPDIEQPLQVRMPEIKGPIPPVRPWVLYEFVDPALESLSAGQKILLRMGPVNERRLKAKLTDIRRRLVNAGVGR